MRDRWFSRPRWEFGFAFVVSFLVWGLLADGLARLAVRVGLFSVIAWPFVYLLTVRLVVVAARLARIAFFTPKRTGDAILAYVERRAFLDARRAQAIAQGAAPGQLSQAETARRAGALSDAR